MQQIINVSGMTCEACEYKIQHLFGGIEGVKEVKINRTANQAILTVDKVLINDLFRDVLKPFSKYALIEKPIVNEISEERISWITTYKPLLIITAFITGVAFLTAFHGNIYAAEHFNLRMFLHNFMTGFFLVFSFFKLLNIKDFASSFAMYDLLAMKLPVYGKIYPFIELGLGILCLIHFQPEIVYWLDILIMGFGALGVIQSVLDKRKIKCACLGAVFNLPMSTVTIIENTIMVALGVILLVLS
jgi:copper chaperone CopZ